MLKALVARAGVDPAAVEDVVFGCLDTVGPQAGDIARTCWLAAGLPEEVPGVTVDRQCGSSQQAVHFAAQGVLSGTQDLVVAGGVQNMTQIPIAFASRQAAEPLGLTEGPFAGSEGWRARYGDRPVNQFHGAELIAEKWGISRRDQEEFALRSHQRAIRAIDEGRFEREVVPFGDVTVDEGPRRDTSLEKMAGLKPVVEGGTHHRRVSPPRSPTAPPRCSSPPSGPCGSTGSRLGRGSTICPCGGRTRYGCCRRRFRPPRTRLKKAGMSIGDIDLVEINEAFAPVVLAWLKETGADPDKVNVNGGAIALGHPLGATGVKLMTTLLHELERTGGRFGLQTMCEGGGQANVTIVERL